MPNNNYREVWFYAMDQIHEEYKNAGPQQETEFKLWFNMTYIEDTDNTITVSVPSEFLWQTMLKKGNIDKIAKKIESLTGQKNIKLQHIVSNENIAETGPSQNPAPQKKDDEKTVSNLTQKKHPQLNEAFTFETFIPGEDNSFAYNAALAAAKEPGKRFNPLLLYG